MERFWWLLTKFLIYDKCTCRHSSRVRATQLHLHDKQRYGSIICPSVLKVISLETVEELKASWYLPSPFYLLFVDSSRSHGKGSRRSLKRQSFSIILLLLKAWSDATTWVRPASMWPPSGCVTWLPNWVLRLLNPLLSLQLSLKIGTSEALGTLHLSQCCIPVFSCREEDLKEHHILGMNCRI